MHYRRHLVRKRVRCISGRYATQVANPIGASTPAAARVEIHESVIDNAGVMRMRELESIDLPARKEVRPRHQGHLHLMLVDLKAPLENGGRFPIRLKFERSGEVEVMVWVQQPKGGAAAEHRH
jgi:copper(I)-binding protein